MLDLYAHRAPQYTHKYHRFASVSYLIHRAEPAADAIRRNLREQNDRAARLLADWLDDPAGRIHETRQTCKKLRAVLRLIRPSARYVYEVENRVYRNVQRGIARARDATAMVEALDLLEARPADAPLRESLRMLRRALESPAKTLAQGSQDTLARDIEVALAELRAADRRLQRLPLDGLRRRDLREGARRTYARCGRRYRAALEQPAAATFHGWRKAVKYSYYQARLLRELAPDWAGQAGPRLRELAEILGQSQDLVLLEAGLAQQADALRVDEHLHRLARLVTVTQQRLRQQALRRGADLFPPRTAAAGRPSALHRGT